MILHVDMDAFYASVEERDQPELVGRAVIVGGTPQGRGVVAAANYVAREFGVHSAMPATQAKRLCPHAIFLRPRMAHYAEVSSQIRAVFERYTPLVEPLSLDEAFLDVTGSETLHGPAIEIARKIKAEIRDALSLVASVGVAPNKFLAKIASDLEKPDGLVVVDPTRIQEFLDPLPVSRLWGVGKVTGALLEKLRVRTIGQLRQLPEDSIQRHLGNNGAHLWELAHGIDSRRVTPEQEAKSISHEKTFATDIEDLAALRAWLLELSEQVACRLRRQGIKARTVHLKLRFDDFHTITRAQSLSAATNVTQEIWESVLSMIDERLPARALRVRLLGVGVSNLGQGKSTQLGLFTDESHERNSRLDEVADSIKAKFGSTSLQRGLGMLHNIDPKSGSTGPNRDQYGE
ncbi:MAG: DNA polymerase IV [Planctomycetales bacterium]|nr:DNA polymerase IV [Planctomycetales bacterium]